MTKPSGLDLKTLDDVLRECLKFKPFNAYAQAYFDAMGESYSLYGMKGVKTQVLYFLNNVRAKGPELQKLKKQLNLWAYE